MEGPEIKAVEAVIDNGGFGTRTLRFETGRLAQQADGAVAAYLDDDSMILSTTTAGSSPKENFDFFPLTVDVEEKMYAAGKIPGSFFRREGRPGTELACRIIDRPLRPLFPHTLRNEVQVVETVLSIDPDDSYDMIAMNAASASTMISGLPFEGPVSGVRLALIDDQWVAFPRWSERERAVFELVVAGRVLDSGDVAIAMIEAGAGRNAWKLIYDEGMTRPDEVVVAGGLEAAKPFIKAICEAQDELKRIAAKETKEFPLFPEYTDELYARIDQLAHNDLNDALSIAEKLPRQDRIAGIRQSVVDTLAHEFADMDDAEKEKEIGNAFKELQRQIVRRRILTQDYRIDGRGLRDIRTLSAEVDVVPRVHGSAPDDAGRASEVPHGRRSGSAPPIRLRRPGRAGPGGDGPGEPAVLRRASPAPRSPPSVGQEEADGVVLGEEPGLVVVVVPVLFALQGAVEAAEATLELLDHRCPAGFELLLREEANDVGR